MEIRKSYHLPHSANRLFVVWTSSETVIPPATRMDINPVVGGHYRLFMETPDFTSSNEGVFIDVKPNSHLKYTWEWNKDGKVTEISVDFVPVGAGTEVKIVHSGFQDAKELAMHDSGWDSYIDGLARYLERTDGG